MTLSLLRSLRELYAFDSTPKFDDLGAFHIPFESMGTGPPVETRMHEGVLRGERIALIAESGCGKSSVISYLLGPAADAVLPVLMPVHALGQEAASADRVADMALAQLARQRVAKLRDARVRAVGVESRAESVQRVSHSVYHLRRRPEERYALAEADDVATGGVDLRHSRIQRVYRRHCDATHPRRNPGVRDFDWRRFGQDGFILG